MLTFPSSYSSALSSPFKENWIVRLYSDSSNYIGIAFGNITMNDSVTYNGCIKNAPSIRESIKLDTGKISSSNLSLECSNITIGSDKLSKHLYTSGSTSYINKNVKIYSVLNGDTSMANALAIYTGRLIGVSVDESGSVKLNIVSWRPYEGLQLPNSLTDNGVYQPVVYGNYEGNLARDTTNHELYPAPFVFQSQGSGKYCVNDTIASGYGSGHYWDSGSRSMATIGLDNNGASTVVKGKPTLSLDNLIERTHRLIPEYIAGQLVDPSLATDSDLSTFADSSNQTVTGSGGSATLEKYIEFSLPSVSGKITDLTMYLKGDVIYTGNANNFDLVAGAWSAVYGGSEGGDTNITALTVTPTSAGTATLSTSGSSSINGSGTAHQSVSLMTAVNANDNELPNSVRIKLLLSVPDTVSLTGRLKVYDVWFKIVTKEDHENEPTSAKKAIEQLKVIYVGADGYTKSWDTNTLIQEAHDAHRDILYRYLGITDAPTNWSTLDSAKDWKCRFYTEPNTTEPILSYLEKLSYEGGFVFRFDSTGNPTYNFIPDSPSADTSISHSQISDLQISHTPFEDIITDWSVKYEKNPAVSEYSSTSTYSDSTARSLYNYNTNENKKEINLSYLVDSVTRTGSNRNDSFLDYYSSIFGSAKQILQFKLNDPTKSNLDVGDTISFSSMSTDKLDGSWSGSDLFIITDTQRSVGGQLRITAREI